MREDIKVNKEDKVKIEKKEDAFKPAVEVIKGEDIKTKINIIHILDGSGSMKGSKFNNALIGMRNEVKELTDVSIKEGIDYTYSVIEFDSYNRIQTICSLVDIHKLNMDDLKFFQPEGMTALYDAIGNTLVNYSDIFNSTEALSKEKVIIKIFTDGGENNSRSKWVHGVELSRLIQKCEKKGWVITFIGTNNDVKNIINRLKISENNTLSYDGSAQGLQSSYQTVNKATIAYSKSVMRGTADNLNFFNNKK